MKRRIKNKNKSTNYVIVSIFLIVFLIFLVSIGWATFSQKLLIDKIGVTVRPEIGIRITGISVSNDNDFNPNGAVSNWEDYNMKNIASSITLPEKDSQIKYKIEITNFGNVDMGLLDITGLPNNLDYKLEGYNLKDKICVDGKCNLGVKKDIYIIIKYKDGMEVPSNNEFTINLSFDFRQFHKITYTNFLINTDSYPKEIIDGGDLEVQFPSTIAQNDIFVSVNKVSTEFQYNNNLLQLKNVLGDVTIQYRTLKDRVMQLANSKKCDYNGSVFDLFVTDLPCDGAAGFNDTPPYYTYFWGTNKCLDFNYVWYSGYMWRITEILNDGSVKMISENILSAINFGQSAYFNDSYIKQWLNEDFLDTLYNHENILVEDATWDISPWYNWCWVDPPKRDTATVGLMNPYEFNKTAGYGSNSFLNLGHAWWLSSYSDPWIDIPTTVSGIHSDGTITAWAVPNNAFGVRPMVVLRADVKFSGAGTQDDPFVLLDDIPNANSGDPINTRTPGELVEINNMLYRIVNTHNEDGKKVTKLKSANYVTGSDGKVIIKKFGDMNSMHSYKDVVNSRDEQYWGAYLNGSWLTEDLKKYLVEDTYYVDNVQKETTDSYIGSYKNTICKDKNTTATTKDCEKTEKTWKGYVGLPIVGELFAYPLGGTDIHDYKTATMTPYGDSGYPMIGAFETETQGIFQETYDRDFAVKPTITLKEEVIITEGDGKTPDSAFKIALPEEYSSN